MGMYYGFNVESDKVDLDDQFPENLGWFSERVGASGENSEFKQLEKILTIDLKLIDHTQYEWDDDDEDCSPGLMNTTVKEFSTVIHELKHKITETPDFHQTIIYQENDPELCRQYLSSNEFMDDLNFLIKLMDTYRDNKIEHFEIYYG